MTVRVSEREVRNGGHVVRVRAEGGRVVIKPATEQVWRFTPDDLEQAFGVLDAVRPHQGIVGKVTDSLGATLRAQFTDTGAIRLAVRVEGYGGSTVDYEELKKAARRTARQIEREG